jgi:hypothetical protein
LNQARREKKVLFIGPLFYNYHNQIITGIEETLPAKVDFITQTFENARLLKIISKFTDPVKYSSDHLQKKVGKWLDDSKREYDYVFVIKGNLINIPLIERLKNEFSNATFIYYNWDSFELYPHSLKISEYFNKKFSFDRSDCEKYKDFKYLTHFHNFDKEKCSNRSPEYDLFFIGALGPGRLEFLENIALQCQEHEISTKFFIRTSWKRYLYWKLIKEHKSLSDYFMWKKLSYDQYFYFLQKARTVVDIEHPRQTGLTQRVIESLSINKKLITTNKNICKESFYDPKDIMVIDRLNPQIDPEFIRSEFESDYPFYEKFSLHTWVKTLFDLPA